MKGSMEESGRFVANGCSSKASSSHEYVQCGQKHSASRLDVAAVPGVIQNLQVLTKIQTSRFHNH